MEYRLVRAMPLGPLPASIKAPWTDLNTIVQVDRLRAADSVTMNRAYYVTSHKADAKMLAVTAGLHDPRIPAWMPAKFAARLQAASHARPTLLRVEMDAGHGVGSTQTQREEEYADIYAFALWQAGIALE